MYKAEISITMVILAARDIRDLDIHSSDLLQEKNIGPDLVNGKTEKKNCMPLPQLFRF
jgi:hypothetical protein